MNQQEHFVLLIKGSMLYCIYTIRYSVLICEKQKAQGSKKAFLMPVNRRTGKNFLFFLNLTMLLGPSMTDNPRPLSIRIIRFHNKNVKRQKSSSLWPCIIQIWQKFSLYQKLSKLDKIYSTVLQWRSLYLLYQGSQTQPPFCSTWPQ